MAISQAMCASFRLELLTGVHNFVTDLFKISLHASAASLDATTTVYDPSNFEITGTGYTTSGIALVNVTPSLVGTTAVATFALNPGWTNATFTAAGALVYNSSKGNRAVIVLDLGGSAPVINGSFTLTLPTPTAVSGLIRFP